MFLQLFLAFLQHNMHLFLPVLVSYEGSCKLDVVCGPRLEFAHCGLTLFDHVKKHLRQLGILIQIDQVGKTVVHFECHTYFLRKYRARMFWTADDRASFTRFRS